MGFSHASAIVQFRKLIEQDTQRATWVRELNLKEDHRALRRDCQTDGQGLALLPGLQSLTVALPSPEFQVGDSLLLSPTIDPSSNAPILRYLTSLTLDFSYLQQQDVGESQPQSYELYLVYLPSLRYLSVANHQMEEPMAPWPGPTAIILPPLAELTFTGCNLHQATLETIFAIRPTRALAVDSFSPTAPSPSSLSSTYVDEFSKALRRTTATLEMLE